MDARSLTSALGGKWQRQGYGLCRCPVHADKTASLKVRDDARKSDGVDVHCFAGCDWKDIKDVLKRQRLLPEFALGERHGELPPGITIAAPAEDANKRELARKIWQAAGPLRDTPGWHYFTKTRELDIAALDLSHALRWHGGFSAVIALMTDPVTGTPRGIHRTFLNPDGTKRERKMLGNAGAVRLSPDEDVTLGLGIAEGVEDALAVLLSSWAPVWAATSAGAMERFPVLAGIESLTIFADNDEPGLKAAEACADQWSAAEREARITPLKDVLQ